MKYLWLVFPAILGTCLAHVGVYFDDPLYWVMLMTSSIPTAVVMN